MRIRCPGCETEADALDVGDGRVQVCAHYEDGVGGATCPMTEQLVHADDVEVIEP